MNNILVISGNRSFLQSLETEFGKIADQHRLFIADNGPLGLEILKEERIDFVAATMRPPGMEDEDFLTSLRRISPSAPVVIMTSDEETCLGNTFLQMNVLKVLLEPVTPSRLIECIHEILFLKGRQGRLRDISLVNFLQLIELEKKTYLLEVRNPTGGTGLFYFHNGVLFDALCDELYAEEAAIKMIGWDKVEIEFRTPPTKKVQKRIKKSLISLIMDGLAPIDDGEKHNKGEAELTPELAPELVSEPAPEPAAEPVPAEAAEEARSTPAKEAEKAEEDRRSPNLAQLLQELYDLRGVKAALLVNQDGRIIDQVGSWPGASLTDIANPVKLAYGGADRMLRQLRLSGLQSLTLESDGAVIMCLPAGDELLTILAQDSRTLGIIRQKSLKLSMKIDQLRKYRRT